MRRALLAVAVLLTIAASPTFAGYIIIRVLLEGDGAGAGADSLMPGLPGGTFGGPPGMGMPLGSSKPGMGSSMGPRPGMGSSMGPRPGMGSSMGPGMGGTTGARPGMGSSMGPRPGMGSSMGPRPGFGPPMPGGEGGMTAPAVDPASFDHTRSVVVVIPLEADLVQRNLDSKRAGNKDNNPLYRKFSFSYYGQRQQSALFVDSTTIQLYTELLDKPAPRKTRGTEMKLKHSLWEHNKDNPRLLYEAMILALESGIIRDLNSARTGVPPMDAITFAQELLDLAGDKKITLPADIEQFVKAWGEMSKSVKMPAAQPSDAEDWRLRLDARAVRVDGHYAIIFWDSPEPEVTRRAMQLNDNFTAFYMWHATRGLVLPVPSKPLIAVLAQQGQAVRPLYRALDGLPMQTDAFFSPDHNILVLSPERLDDVGQTFLRQTHQVFVTGFNRSMLLNGEIPKLDHTGEKGSRPDDVARANTLAVVEKLVTDEAEIAAVSHEGTRQLLFATGLLPQHVTLPNWLTQGSLNFFTRPRGPAFITKGDKPYMSVAFTTGYGVPNYVLQSYFHDLEQHKELNPVPAKLLENILSDAYFAGIKNGDDPDPTHPKKHKKPTHHAGPPMTGGLGPKFGPPGLGSSGGPPGLGGKLPAMGMGPGGMGGLGGMGAVEEAEEDPIVLLRQKRERLTIKAQATSWALYYYLANARPLELKKYVAELNKLPRDLPIDGRTAYKTFVRVFGLGSPDGIADPVRMQRFATDWLKYINVVPRASFDIPLVVPEAPKNGNEHGTMPLPGGFNPPPGGSR